jgi:type VI secretion system secreted protein VgrG
LTTTVGTGGAALCKLDVTGKHEVTVSDTIEITATTHIKLTCGASTILMTPNEIQLTAGGKSIMNLDVNAFVKSSGGSSVMLDKNAAMTANGEARLLLDANALMTSKGKSKVLLDGDATMDSATGNTNVTAAVKVALAGAKVSQLDLEASGATLGSPTTKVTGKGLTEVTGPMVKIN